nr:4Fe-4S binding protein [Catellatospora coxensis]
MDGAVSPVRFDGCQGCGACLLTCPTHAIRPIGGTGPARLYARPGLCTGCGECVEVCPVDAVTLVEREAR